MTNVYVEQFRRLNLQKNRNQWPAETNHCAPYKPLLLLAVIDLISEQRITNNLIELIPERRMGDLTLPFYHLQNDGFWHLVPKPGKEVILETGVVLRSMSKLQENTLGARLDDDLFHLLQHDDARPCPTPRLCTSRSEINYTCLPPTGESDGLYTLNNIIVVI